MKLSPIAKGLLLGFIILIVSLGSGMIGFKYFCPITWHDAFLNAAMLLTGMAPYMNPLPMQVKCLLVCMPCTAVLYSCHWWVL
ncbi:MAG: hypothetical protein IPJ20_17650 [Flammeovirgaceae bacterium]|nr:hypothetical protein [Flammeovirgaceae bacterium]